MKPWEDKLVEVGHVVRDTDPNPEKCLGVGTVMVLYPAGADVVWEDGHIQFCGFAWLELIKAKRDSDGLPDISDIPDL